MNAVISFFALVASPEATGNAAVVWDRVHNGC